MFAASNTRHSGIRFNVHAAGILQLTTQRGVFHFQFEDALLQDVDPGFKIVIHLFAVAIVVEVRLRLISAESCFFHEPSIRESLQSGNCPKVPTGAWHLWVMPICTPLVQRAMLRPGTQLLSSISPESAALSPGTNPLLASRLGIPGFPKENRPLAGLHFPVRLRLWQWCGGGSGAEPTWIQRALASF